MLALYLDGFLGDSSVYAFWPSYMLIFALACFNALYCASLFYDTRLYYRLGKPLNIKKYRKNTFMVSDRIDIIHDSLSIIYDHIHSLRRRCRTLPKLRNGCK